MRMNASSTPTRYKVAFGFLIFFTVASLFLTAVCGAIVAAVVGSIGASDGGSDAPMPNDDAAGDACNPYAGAVILLIIGGLLLGGIALLSANAALALAGALVGLALLLHRKAVEPWIYTGACVFEVFCCGELLIFLGILFFVII